MKAFEKEMETLNALKEADYCKYGKSHITSIIKFQRLPDLVFGLEK